MRVKKQVEKVKKFLKLQNHKILTAIRNQRFLKKEERFLVKEEKDKRGELGDVVDGDSGRKKLLEVEGKNRARYEGLPYVWGGNSPSGVLSFLKRILGKKQSFGSWREGQPIVPGFDCSGWVQHNLRQAGYNVPNSLKKISCKTLYPLRTTEGSVKEIAKIAKPGDAILLRQEGKDPEHVVFYLGNGKISESSGKKQGIREDSPAYQDWVKYAEPGKKGKAKEDMGGIQTNDISKYEGKFIASLVPLDKLKK